MKGRYLHVYLDPSARTTESQIEDAMNKAVDWVKYDDHVWLVYSKSVIEIWKARLKPLVGKDGTFFVCEIDITKRAGWMKKGFWEWIKKPRD